MKPLYIFLFNVVAAAFCLLLIQPQLTRAYVGCPSRITASDEDRFSLSVEGIADVIYNRGAKHQVDDMTVEFYGAEAGLTYKGLAYIYGGAGAARVEEVYDTISGRTDWESDYGFTWLVGSMFKLYETELKNIQGSRLLFSVDIQYRNTDLETDSVTIDSVKYKIPDPSITQSTMEYNDWHVALSCLLDMKWFSPYIGIKYSDFESTVRATKNGTVYQKDNCEADNNFGIFIGVGIAILDQVSGQVEASFIDENSISGSLSIRF